MRVAITASGGGHTGYAIAIAEQLLTRGIDVVIIVDPADTWSLEKIRHRLGDRVEIAFARQLRGAQESLVALLRRLPTRLADLVKIHQVLADTDILICTGSNHSLLPALYARALGKPVLCIEAVDRIATRSKTVALLHDLAAVPVALHWPAQRKLYRRAAVVGPIYEKPLYKPAQGDYILVITGTEGNPALVKKLVKTSLQNIVLQTGRTVDPQLIARHKPTWKVFRYHPDIAALMARAKLVVAHQGLSLVEAALAYQKPVLLALNPDLPRTSGLEDAVHLARYLNTKAVNPAELTPRQLEENIFAATQRRPPRYLPGAHILATHLTYLMKSILNKER
ncbi:glycosyltransferase [Pyrodictium abyssi]|uniref:glycosyltransferase n=1 Tax=Pyrodictium abyssi TaxID=54256 RepID=UPI0030C7464F